MINGKSFYLLHSKQDYRVSLSALPERCPKDKKSSLVLIKLPSVTHGWDSGQRLIDLPFERSDDENVIRFTSPDREEANIPPGFYMMFYVDCRGKPSKAQMVSFDDSVDALD